MRNSSTLKRKRTQSGHAFMESALVIVPLIIMIVVIFDLAAVLFVKSTFEHAAREGARYAITYQTESGMGHDASIKQIVRQNAMGLLNDNNITITYYDKNDPSAVAAAPGNSPENVVVIEISAFNWSFAAPALLGGTPAAGIRARSADRMEFLAFGTPAPAR